MSAERIRSNRWARPALAAALFAIACLPLTSTAHAHPFPDELRIGAETAAQVPSVCQLCRLCQERALPAGDAGQGPAIARIGLAPSASLSLPASILVPHHPSRAPPSDL